MVFVTGVILIRVVWFRLDDMFFAKQVISNACATQAIINLLLNCENEDISLGDNLSTFKGFFLVLSFAVKICRKVNLVFADFTKSFDAQTAGLAISNQEQLRQVHNSFSRHQIFEMEEKQKQQEEASFHFVGYIPFKGRLVLFH